MKYFFILILISCFSDGVFGSPNDGSGLQISAAGDLNSQIGLHSGSGATDRLDVREVEFSLFAPIDHVWNGNLSFAAHYEGAVSHLELHEASIGSDVLIPRSRFKLGQYLLGIGRLNRFHRHDWPFISAPKYHVEFFDEEGLMDTGLEYAYLFPTPFFLELTLGIANGFTFGHSHTEGSRPLFPTHYARLGTFTDLSSEGGLQAGLNYLGRKSNEGTVQTYFGVDLTAKWKDNAILRYLVQSEFWYRILSPSNTTTQKAFGFYLYPQYGFSKEWLLGMRFDYFSNVWLPDATEATSKNFEAGFVPTLSYKASEFSTVRLAYHHTFHYLVDRFTDSQRMFEIQAVFILGAHPAHDF